MPDHFEHQLDNGLTILAEPTPTARSFACGLFVKTGTRDEPRELNGVSHFLEHMMFKGSDARDAAAMNRIFDELGADYNAFTTQEMTAYYAVVLPEFTDTVMEHVGHLFRPALRDEDLETERQVILEEIAMYADDPGHRLFEAAMSRHWRDHPMAMSILGPAETIAELPRDGMAEYHRTHYGPRNTVLSVTGRFDFDEVVRLADRHYGHWQPVGFDREYAGPDPASGRTDLVDAKLNRQYLMGLCPGPAADDDRRFAARILADLLGDGDGSRLYWALVDPAICDEADFGPYPHDHCGSFVLSLTCRPGRMDEAFDIATRELRRVSQDLTETEIARSKNKLAGRATLHGESAAGRMRAIGSSWVYNGGYRSLAQDLDALLAVTLDDVRQVLHDFSPEPTTLVTLGPGEA
jgi:predicted Zn-dependent peptidase